MATKSLTNDTDQESMPVEWDHCRESVKGLASEDLSKVKVRGAFFPNSRLTVNPKRVKGKGKSLRRKLTELSGTYVTTYTLPPAHPPSISRPRTVQSSPPQLLSEA